MKRSRALRLIMSLGVGLCLLGAPALTLGAMVDLGTLGGTTSTAYGINDRGQIVGQSTTELAGQIMPFSIPGSPAPAEPCTTWAPSKEPIAGLTPSTTTARLWAGPVPDEGDTHAFLYTGVPGVDGVMHDLGTLGGTSSEAWDINSSGQIVGYSLINADPPIYHAFLYIGVPGAGGVMHDLGTLGGTEGNSYAYGINDNGAIVGKSEIISGPHAGETHAFLYIGVPGEGGFMHDLGTLVEENYFDSEAHAINNLSQIVGWSMINANPSQYNAFRLYGTMADLGTLGGGTSEAWGINDRGQIVGNAAIAGEGWIRHAFLYDRGSMKDLGTLGGI